MGQPAIHHGKPPTFPLPALVGFLSQLSLLFGGIHRDFLGDSVKGRGIREEHRVGSDDHHLVKFGKISHRMASKLGMLVTKGAGKLKHNLQLLCRAVASLFENRFHRRATRLPHAFFDSL